MRYLADASPPGQEGWTRHQEKYREASFDGAQRGGGDQTEMFLNLNHHPVCADSDASHFLLMAQPPLLARRAMTGSANPGLKLVTARPGLK